MMFASFCGYGFLSRMHVYTKLRKTTGVDRNTTQMFSEREGFSLSLLYLTEPHLTYRHDLVWASSKRCHVLFDPLGGSSGRLFCLLLRLKQTDGQCDVLPNLHPDILDKAWHTTDKRHQAAFSPLCHLID